VSERAPRTHPHIHTHVSSPHDLTPAEAIKNRCGRGGVPRHEFRTFRTVSDMEIRIFSTTVFSDLMLVSLLLSVLHANYYLNNHTHVTIGGFVRPVLQIIFQRLLC
jgi:hypothetical protein